MAEASLLLDFLFLLNLLLCQDVEDAALCLGISLTCTLEGGSFTIPKSHLQKVIQKPASTFASSSELSLQPVNNEREEEKQTLQERSTIGPRVNCSICPKSFTIKVSLNRHMAKRHMDAAEISESFVNAKKEGQTFDCELCGKKLPSLQMLEWHGNEAHASGKKYKCDKCVKSFLTELMLKKHTRLHTGSGELACGVCQKRFPSNSSLYMHRNIHLEEKPFRCDDCDKGFNQKGNLKAHLQKCHGKELIDVISEGFNSALVRETETMEGEGSFSEALQEERKTDNANKSEVFEQIVSEVLE